MRVLVVEDHGTLADRIAQGLRQVGMAVDAVYDGAAALDAVAQTDYDVIVLDRDLPVVHGDQVCKTMAGTGTRIIMLTAAGDVAAASARIRRPAPLRIRSSADSIAVRVARTTRTGAPRKKPISRAGCGSRWRWPRTWSRC